MRSIVLDGLKMRVLDEYLQYVLVHRESADEYLILRNDIPHEYIVVQNFNNDKISAFKEFDNMKEN